MATIGPKKRCQICVFKGGEVEVSPPPSAQSDHPATPEDPQSIPCSKIKHLLVLNMLRNRVKTSLRLHLQGEPILPYRASTQGFTMGDREENLVKLLRNAMSLINDPSGNAAPSKYLRRINELDPRDMFTEAADGSLERNTFFDICCQVKLSPYHIRLIPLSHLCLVSLSFPIYLSRRLSATRVSSHPRHSPTKPQSPQSYHLLHKVSEIACLEGCSGWQTLTGNTTPAKDAQILKHQLLCVHRCCMCKVRGIGESCTYGMAQMRRPSPKGKSHPACRLFSLHTGMHMPPNMSPIVLSRPRQESNPGQRQTPNDGSGSLE